jgi:hypothetical protein
MDEKLCLKTNQSAKYHIVTLHNQPYRVISGNILSRYQKLGIQNPIDQLNLSSESAWKMLFKVSHLLWMNSLLRHADIADMPKFLQLFDSLEREFSAIQMRLEWMRKNASSTQALEKKLFCSLKPYILQTSDLCAEWLYPRRWVIQEILMKSDPSHNKKVCDMQDYSTFFYDDRIPLWWKNLVSVH